MSRYNLPGYEYFVEKDKLWSLNHFSGTYRSATYQHNKVQSIFCTVWIADDGKMRCQLQTMWELFTIKSGELSFPNENFEKIFLRKMKRLMRKLQC